MSVTTCGAWRGLEQATGAAAAGAAALCLHAVVNGRLLRRPVTPIDEGRTAVGRPSVSVLVPARDEARRIGPTLAAVLDQQGVDVEVLVLDDGSSDGTGRVVLDVAAGDPRLTLLRGAPLPEGWLGKPHACWQLAKAARGEVLVFVDADVVLEPGALAASIDLLVAAGLDLLSPYPRQTAVSVAERLVQPLLQWSWLTFLPLRIAERTASTSLTAANGQLLLARADTYRAAGGHRAVRDAVIEDIDLARAVTRAGGTVAMADGTDLATCRMYDGWAELRDGYTKSLWTAFGSTAGAAGVLALLGWLYLLPPVAAVIGLRRRRGRLAALGASGYAAGVAGRVVTARRTGSAPADAVAHPASIAVLAWLVAASVRRRRAGTLAWKGRVLT